MTQITSMRGIIGPPRGGQSVALSPDELLEPGPLTPGAGGARDLQYALRVYERSACGSVGRLSPRSIPADRLAPVALALVLGSWMAVLGRRGAEETDFRPVSWREQVRNAAALFATFIPTLALVEWWLGL